MATRHETVVVEDGTSTDYVTVQWQSDGSVLLSILSKSTSESQAVAVRLTREQADRLGLVP